MGRRKENPIFTPTIAFTRLKHLKPFLYPYLLCYLSIQACLAQPALRRVVVNGHENGTLPIQLTATNSDLVLDFQSITGDSVRYFYRIKELNSDWTQSFYPSAHYQNLSGGVYTFELFAHAKGKNSAMKRLTINVTEATWQKPWFYPSIALNVLLIVGIGLYLFFLYDFRQKLKMQHVRNQIASDLHDEVGSNLSSIAIFVEVLRQRVQQNNPELLPILNKITDNSEETVTLMRDTVWAINPNNDSTEKLLEKMRSFGLQLLSAKDIVFTFEYQLDLKKTTFSMEQRRNLYLVYKEALNNIAKHAQANQAYCVIFKQHNTLHIQISDNGKGFDTEQIFEGNGLNNFKSRSQEESLQVSVTSGIGKGTVVEILIE